jgi:hypothetical protein
MDNLPVIIVVMPIHNNGSLKISVNMVNGVCLQEQSHQIFDSMLDSMKLNQYIMKDRFWF